MARPKDIGTAAETAVVNWAKDHGFPQARRLALAGADDQGDVELKPGWTVEVKGGRAAETASDLQIDLWLVETGQEFLAYTRATRLPVPSMGTMLVTKRKGYSADRAGYWSAWMRLWWLADLLCTPRESTHEHTVVRMTFDDALILIYNHQKG